MRVRLFLSTQPGFVSEVIRRGTNCDYSHAGFIDLDTRRTFSAMCDGKGVTWRDPDPNAKLLILSALGQDAALSKALTQEGKPYDELDIAGIVLGRDWETPGAWICDKLVFWAFEQNNAPLVNPGFIPLEHLTPRDILLSPYVTEEKL